MSFRSLMVFKGGPLDGREEVGPKDHPDGSCWKCGGTLWVCEQHRGPWPHESEGEDCPGPGEPCRECDPLIGRER